MSMPSSTDPGAPLGVAVLGSTGSIGRQALEVLEGNPAFRVVALGAGKIVATANKETLVAGGHLVMPLARARAAARAEDDPRDPLASPLGWLRPIDSEHSAIWQCLVGEDLRWVERLILTASGGPFL